LDIRDLQLIRLTALGQSLSQAAETLGISQPTATKLIQNLETELGGNLFFRGKRPIQLTPLGRSMAERASPLVEEIERLIPQAPQDESAQPIVIAATTEIFAHVLTDVLGRFHVKWPDVRFAIREGVQNASFESVVSGQVHFMIGEKPAARLRLDYAPLGVVRRVVLAPISHPLLQVRRLTFGELAKWPIIVSGIDEYDPSPQALLAGFKRQGLQGTIAFEVGNMDSMKRYVAMGFGVGAGPAYIVEPRDLEQLAVISASSLLPNREMGIVTLPGKPLPAQTTNLLEMITSEVPTWLEQIQSFDA
jgi:DNA-binding transcriptional LysR family regulator